MHLEQSYSSPIIGQNSPIAMQNSKISPWTTPRTFVSGDGKFVFVLRKITKALQYSNAEFTNSPGTIPRTRGEESLFSFSENVPKLFYSNAEFNKKSWGRNPGPPFLGTEGECCLLLKLCATPLSIFRFPDTLCPSGQIPDG